LIIPEKEGVFMAVRNVLAGITVKDFSAALAWYERLLGRPADAIPMEGDAEWHLCESGGIQLYHNKNHTGSTFVVLTVTNLDDQIAQLQAQEITVEPVQTVSVGKIATVNDPEGNLITFLEPFNL
jgi:predicted enzyme related to lactoylglutathione lyase